MSSACDINETTNVFVDDTYPWQTTLPSSIPNMQVHEHTAADHLSRTLITCVRTCQRTRTLKTQSYVTIGSLKLWTLAFVLQNVVVHERSQYGRDVASCHPAVSWRVRERARWYIIQIAVVTLSDCANQCSRSRTRWCTHDPPIFVVRARKWGSACADVHRHQAHQISINNKFCDVLVDLDVRCVFLCTDVSCLRTRPTLWCSVRLDVLCMCVRHIPLNGNHMGWFRTQINRARAHEHYVLAESDPNHICTSCAQSGNIIKLHCTVWKWMKHNGYVVWPSRFWKVFETMSVCDTWPTRSLLLACMVSATLSVIPADWFHKIPSVQIREQICM